jgi:acetyl-CoA acetyltransferase
VENACASGSTAVHAAATAIAAGQADVAVALGVERLTHPDKTRTFDAIGTATDLGNIEELQQQVNPDGGSEGARSLFMDVYAWLAAEHARTSGATPDDYARVSVKNHGYGAANPHAQFRRPRTVEEVLASRPITGPLTLLMCSPIGDGAAAVVLCSDRYRARHGPPSAVRLAATALVAGRDRGPGDEPAVTRAARRAYDQAGIAPADVDVAEVHDAAAPAELIAYEELLLCAPGDGPDLLRSGATGPGGQVPVNTSGGLLAKGHPIGATGCAQIVALHDQLLGRAGGPQVPGARVALAENSGGYLSNDPAVAVVTVLTR